MSSRLGACVAEDYRIENFHGQVRALRRRDYRIENFLGQVSACTRSHRIESGEPTYLCFLFCTHAKLALVSDISISEIRYRLGPVLAHAN